MSENQHLKQNIVSWLLDEGLPSEKGHSTTRSEFHLHIPNAYGFWFHMDVVRPEDKPIIQTSLTIDLSSEVIRGFTSLPEEERARFSAILDREIFQLGVEKGMYPNSLQPTNIIIGDDVFEEDITRTLFIGSIRRLKRAGLLTTTLLLEKFPSH